MIIQKSIYITLNSRHINYFEKLGYNIPKYIDKQNRLLVKKGTKIKIKVSDLPPRSNIKVLYKCDKCGKLLKVVYNNLYKKSQHLCTSCRLTIRKVSKETKIKLSIQKIGNKNPMFGKYGKQNPNWNFNLTEEERKIKRSISGIGKWKKEVKERDNHTCQKCGSHKNLEVHHIDGFSNFKEQRLLVENGITLCFDCHRSKNKSIHHIFGSFTTKDNLNEFMKNY